MLIAKFNEYESTYTETSIGFEGEMYASIGEILECDELAYQEDEVIKKLKTNYNYMTNSFSMTVSYYSGDTLLKTEEIDAEPFYDEVRDDGYLEFEGQRYYISESFDVNGLNECVAVVDDLVCVGVVAVCAIAITIVASDPTVRQEINRTIETVVETVVEAVKSFWSWLTSWVKKTFTKQVETTTVVEVITPKVKINENEYETEEVSEADRKKLPQKAYYLVLADPTNKTVYMSIVQIDATIAQAVMLVAVPVTCIGDTNYQMILSVYTRNHTDAIAIMDIVGYSPRTPKWSPEFEFGAYHYHSLAEAIISVRGSVNGESRSPHMFFDFMI